MGCVATRDTDNGAAIFSRLSPVFATKNESVHEHYTIISNSIRKDSLGETYKAIDIRSQEVRGLKIIAKEGLDSEKKAMFNNEVFYQRQLSHDNILKLYDIFEDDENYYVVQELFLGGELFDKLIELQSLDEGKVVSIARQLLSAAACMHKSGIIYRDFKLENIVLQSKGNYDWNVKVNNFQLASEAPRRTLRGKVGSTYYQSPEMIAGSYDFKTDVWSIGVICHTLLCGYPPFIGENPKNTEKMIRNEELEFSEDWDEISQEAQNFIRRLLNKEIGERPTAEAALRDRWLLRFNDNGLLRRPATLGHIEAEEILGIDSPIKRRPNKDDFYVEITKRKKQYIEISMGDFDKFEDSGDESD